MELKDIQNLIKFVSKSDVSEVKYKTNEFEITIKTPQAESTKVSYITAPQTPAIPVASATATPAAPAPTQEAAAPAKPAADNTEADDSKYVAIKSPMIGTFYRKPAPDKDPFVSVGDNITSESIVCVIEAMKLFNQIEAEVSGKIVKILVDDATPVEYDQPLFLVDPS